MNESENAAVAREAVAAFQRGDIEAFLGFLDPDVEVFSTPELPNPGSFKGRGGWMKWAGEWLDAWDTFEIEPLQFEPVGEHHVLMPVRQHGIGKGSGVEVEMRACYMIELHDGLATRFHFYGDREKAVEAAVAGEASDPPAG